MAGHNNYNNVEMIEDGLSAEDMMAKGHGLTYKYLKSVVVFIYS